MRIRFGRNERGGGGGGERGEGCDPQNKWVFSDYIVLVGLVVRELEEEISRSPDATIARLITLKILDC